jgi:hypothetical protein
MAWLCGLAALSRQTLGVPWQILSIDNSGVAPRRSARLPGCVAPDADGDFLSAAFTQLIMKIRSSN